MKLRLFVPLCHFSLHNAETLFSSILTFWGVHTSIPISTNTVLTVLSLTSLCIWATNLLSVKTVTWTLVLFHELTLLNAGPSSLLLGVFEALPAHIWKLCIWSPRLHEMILCNVRFLILLPVAVFCVCVWFKIAFVSYVVLKFLFQKGKLCC